MRLTKRSLIPIRQSRTLVQQRPDKAWAVYAPSNAPAGQRKVIRRYFRNKVDAERYCSIARAELTALGVQANRLTDSLKLELYRREQLPITATITANRIRAMGPKMMISPQPRLRVMTESSVVMTLLGPSGAAFGLSRRGLPQPGQDWASLDTSFWQSGHLIRLVVGLGAVGGGGTLASISESRLLTFAQAAIPLVQ